MKKNLKASFSRKRLLAFAIMMMGAFLLMSMLISSENVSANHPVLVEGNCDSPVPGTTIVAAGTCGDYDGDGRIGTEEDTDGADRIFGTIRAALGQGTGMSVDTGINHNGTITIVRSGRFNEQLFIGNAGFATGEGIPSPGNVTLEAAPGVEAILDAVKQGDVPGSNEDRQSGTGISIVYQSPDRKVTLRNLTIRNYAWGIYTSLNSRVTIDNCRFENNLNYGIQAVGFSRLFIINSRFTGTGFRIGTAPSNTPTPGHAISYEGAASGEVAQSQITGSAGRGLSSTSSGAVTFYELFVGDNAGGNIVGATRNNAP